MRYVELLGIPGAGKSTLLQAIRDVPVAFRTKTFSSSSFAAQRHRFFVGRNFSDSRETLVCSGLENRVSQYFFDGWSRNSVTDHPELFSRVLHESARIEKQGRQRQIVLNYWRSRLSLHSRITQSSSLGWGVVDEGLCQTLVSTLVRSQNSVRDGDAGLNSSIQRIAECFPDRRVVVLLEASPNLARSRKGSSGWYSDHQVRWREELVMRVAEREANRGVKVLRLRASRNPRFLAEQLLSGLDDAD